MEIRSFFRLLVHSDIQPISFDRQTTCVRKARWAVQNLPCLRSNVWQAEHYKSVSRIRSGSREYKLLICCLNQFREFSWWWGKSVNQMRSTVRQRLRSVDVSSSSLSSKTNDRVEDEVRRVFTGGQRWPRWNNYVLVDVVTASVTTRPSTLRQPVPSNTSQLTNSQL